MRDLTPPEIQAVAGGIQVVDPRPNHDPSFDTRYCA